MRKSLRTSRENVTGPELSDADTPSPDVTSLADVLTTLPESDRIDIIVDLSHDQRLDVARLLAAKIKENKQ